LDKLTQIAEQYNPNGPVVDVKEYGTGNVNDTYLVTLDAPGGNSYFIMQRINQRVFHQPELIMLNMAALSEHVRLRLEQEARSSVPARRWETPRIYYAKDGRNYQLTDDGSFWRAMSFINHSTAYPRIRDAHHASEAGYALGRFQSLISDMQVNELHDTLVGFHITPGYLRHYDEVLACNSAQQGLDIQSADARFCAAFVEQHRKIAKVL
jgi:hypothetical protein